jgi:hypothetical protein
MRWCLVTLAVLGGVGCGTAHAAELDQASLRGSSADDVAPRYKILPYDVAPQAPIAAGAPAEPHTLPPRPAPWSGLSFEAGTRYWWSSGTLAKDLYDDPRSSQYLNSRLTYAGLTGGAFEAFGRVDNPFGTFIKGNIGFAGLDSGTLTDEDFQPNTAPYSNTLSQQQSGRLDYGSIDIGQTVTRNARASVGLFVGYGYLAEETNAFGCSQTAGNPDICQPAIASTVQAITEDTRWQFVRLGLIGEIKLLDRLKLSAEAAWLPYAQVNAQDTHWLRLGSSFGSIAGPIPENGSGPGVQLEALLSYQVTDRFSLGLGGRYWYLETRGSADFEQVIVGATSPIAQPLNFTTTRYGAFAQGAYRFGPF